jgi:hypothetical protein
MENGMKEAILDQDDEAYIAQRVVRRDGELIIMENQFMVIPRAHIAGPPPAWLYGKLPMLSRRGIQIDNLSVNLTVEGGAENTEHTHIHAIKRVDGRRLGMNGLIESLDSTEKELTELRRVSNVQLNGH